MREQKDRYEIFLKVCETGSFSKAAEALNYTQSGISQMMAGLEEELGVKLFARINRGVTLTPEGEMLYSRIASAAVQRDTSFALRPGTGQPEEPAAAGGVQYQPQGGGQAAGGQLFQHHNALDAGSGVLFQGELPEGEYRDPGRQL